MKQMFPRTLVGGVSLPRMIIGSNWMLGYSHTGEAADELILSRNGNEAAIAEIVGTYLQYGIDAIMAPKFDSDSAIEKGIRIAEEQYNKKVIRIATPIIQMEDTKEARREAEKQIAKCKSDGAAFCLIHHASCERLINRMNQTIDRLPDYLDMIRTQGMIPGLSAHMPEVILYSDKNNYDVETYIQIYNCLGFLMQVEIENVNSIIHDAKKPVMTIKSMAAGRCTPFVGLSFSYGTIRDCDMVTVGAFTPSEVEEDVEIAMATIEHRRPMLGRRNSPAMTDLLVARR